jgi:hypothetical protein
MYGTSSMLREQQQRSHTIWIHHAFEFLLGINFRGSVALDFIRKSMKTLVSRFTWLGRFSTLHLAKTKYETTY